MIRDDEDLAVVREQLALAQQALETLREDVKNPRNFAVFSEGYVAQIDALKAEIDAYKKAKRRVAVNGKAKSSTTRGRQKT